MHILEVIVQIFCCILQWLIKYNRPGDWYGVGYHEYLDDSGLSHCGRLAAQTRCSYYQFNSSWSGGMDTVL